MKSLAGSLPDKKSDAPGSNATKNPKPTGPFRSSFGSRVRKSTEKILKAFNIHAVSKSL